MNLTPEHVKTYTITNATYCLISHPIRNKLHTFILDKHGSYLAPIQPLRILRQTCLLHGSTYEAAKAHAQEFFGQGLHKMPIMVAYNFGDPCVMFPLFSPHSKQNVWLSVNGIINIETRNECTLVTFMNGTEQVFPVQLKSFKQQYVRAVIYHKNLVLQRRAFL